ncbi:MAG: 4-hydroxybenzoate octaprenyltransferase, partial [Methyloligellaceae bacterium]
WPCWWSVALAGRAAGTTVPDIWLLILFAIGAVVMRAAGCTYNDIVDKNYDARVARTRSRPIPSGQVSVREAQVFMVVLCFTGLAVLLQFNLFAIGLGIASLAIVAIYPFMKRVTHWPQIVLGLAFSWGALMGWAALYGALAWPPVLLYAGTVMWTIGYDTIYAHQDKEDDALLGLKSTALRFGPTTRRWLALFYGTAWLALTAAGLQAGAGFVFLGVMGGAAAMLAWQVVTLDIDDAVNCLSRFRSNRDVGAIVFAALVLDMAMRAFA